MPDLINTSWQGEWHNRIPDVEPSNHPFHQNSGACNGLCFFTVLFAELLGTFERWNDRSSTNTGEHIFNSEPLVCHDHISRLKQVQNDGFLRDFFVRDWTGVKLGDKSHCTTWSYPNQTFECGSALVTGEDLRVEYQWCRAFTADFCAVQDDMQVWIEQTVILWHGGAYLLPGHLNGYWTRVISPGDNGPAHRSHAYPKNVSDNLIDWNKQIYI